MTPSILPIVVLRTMRNSRPQPRESPDATVGWSITERADSQNVFPPEADGKSLMLDAVGKSLSPVNELLGRRLAPERQGPKQRIRFLTTKPVLSSRTRPVDYFSCPVSAVERRSASHAPRIDGFESENIAGKYAVCFGVFTVDNDVSARNHLSLLRNAQNS